MLSTPQRALDFQSSPTHSFLKKGSNTFRKGDTQPQSSSFNEFNLTNFRDKATLKHASIIQSPNLSSKALQRTETESPSSFLNLKEKINTIGSVRKSTINLSSSSSSKATYHSKTHFMPEKVRLEDIQSIRMQLEAASQDQVQGLSSHYVNELVKVQQCIFRSLKQLPQYKGKVHP